MTRGVEGTWLLADAIVAARKTVEKEGRAGIFFKPIEEERVRSRMRDSEEGNSRKKRGKQSFTRSGESFRSETDIVVIIGSESSLRVVGERRDSATWSGDDVVVDLVESTP